MRHVPFVDLQAQYRLLKQPMDAAVRAVLDSCHFILGPELTEFERAFAEYLGVTHAVGVGSGTDAIELALRACGIGPGDEVITAVNTYFATSEAISAAGATPRWVDADEHTYTLDVARLEAAICSRTRAIVPVHLYGQPVDMDSVMAIAREHDLKVVEDCAQSHGARWRGRLTGSFGDAACFSFFPSKNLGACGDGGAVVTNDAAIAESVRILRSHGMRERNLHVVEGRCSRLDNLQAAILGVKLRYLNGWNERRRSIAAEYTALLDDVLGVVTPYCAESATHVYHLYVVQLPERDRIREILQRKGIETGTHYPIPLHEQPAYASLGYRCDDFPVASRIARRILSLPIFPELTSEQIGYVVDSFREALAAQLRTEAEPLVG